MTEGSLGYILQQNLLNHLRRKDVRRYVVTVVTQVLVEQGFAAPQDLLDGFDIPGQRLVARPHTSENGIVDISYDAPRDVLWHALMLGLCTAQLYDPGRPVLWTQSALRRRLELFDPTGFYA